MKNKKIYILIFLIFTVSQILCAADLSSKKLRKEEFQKKYSLSVNIINEEISKKVDVSIDEVKIDNYKDIYELSYLMYCPIVVIFYLHIKNNFEIEQYVCICMTDNNRNIISINVQKNVRPEILMKFLFFKNKSIFLIPPNCDL